MNINKNPSTPLRFPQGERWEGTFLHKCYKIFEFTLISEQTQGIFNSCRLIFQIETL